MIMFDSKLPWTHIYHDIRYVLIKDRQQGRPTFNQKVVQDMPAAYVVIAHTHRFETGAVAHVVQCVSFAFGECGITSAPVRCQVMYSNIYTNSSIDFMHIHTPAWHALVGCAFVLYGSLC